MPTTEHRVLATVTCCVIGVICLAGKVAAGGIYILCAAMFVHGWHVSRSLRTEPVFLAATADWKWPFGLFMTFAAVAGLSAAWAAAPAESIGAAVGFGANVSLSLLLVMSFQRLPPPAVVLIGGWAVIGFLFGAALLLADILSQSGLSRAALNLLPGIARPQASMMSRDGNLIVSIAPDAANWSVAAVNLLGWPMALLAFVTMRARQATLFQIGILVLVSGITFVSVHESSKLALAASCLAAIVAIVASDRMRRAVVVGCAILFVTVVPLAWASLYVLKLNEAAWAQPSLQDRFVIWGVTAAQVGHSPIAGIGAHNTVAWAKKADAKSATQDPARQPLRTDAHAHNVFLQTWFELGAIGALLLGAACVTTLSRMTHLPREIAPFAVAASVSAIIICLATWNLWHHWLAAAIGIALATTVLGARIASVRRENSTLLFFDIWLAEPVAKFFRLKGISKTD